MIKKDLQDINRLKQSTLKETIKYSFLYPEGDSIFSSIKDVKMSYNFKPVSNDKANDLSVKRSDLKPL